MDNVFEVKVRKEEVGDGLEIASIKGKDPKQLPLVYMVSPDPKVYIKGVGKKDSIVLNIGSEHIHFKVGDVFKTEDVVRLLTTIKVSNETLNKITETTNGFDFTEYMV